MKALPRSLGIFLVALLLIALYIPTLTSPPIWDDNYFIFWRYTFNAPPDLLYVWKFHFWPLFDSVVMALIKWWKHEPLYWRITNLLLHLINSYLLAHLVSLWRPRFFWPMLLLFLVHPLNVMSVAFIIQLKTLLCALFLLLTVHFLWKADQQSKTKYAVVAWIFFFCSVTSKSASLTYPFIAMAALLIFKLHTKRRLLILIPFLLVPAGFFYRVQSNDPMLKRVDAAEESTLGKSMSLITAPGSTPLSILPPALPPLTISKWQMVVDNFGRYQLYTLIPWPLSLAHGRFTGPTIYGVVGMVGWMILLAAGCYRRSRGMIFLLVASAMASIPFLGLVFAPYMSYTAVSEQHLYLILPFALIALLWLAESIPTEHRFKIVAAYIIALSVLTSWYTPSYSSEEELFSRVIDERPHDLFAYVNLAGHYQLIGHEFRAQALIKHAAKLVEENPQLRRDPSYESLRRAWEAYGLK